MIRTIQLRFWENVNGDRSTKSLVKGLFHLCNSEHAFLQEIQPVNNLGNTMIDSNRKRFTYSSSETVSRDEIRRCQFEQRTMLSPFDSLSIVLRRRVDRRFTVGSLSIHGIVVPRYRRPVLSSSMLIAIRIHCRRKGASSSC